MHCSEHSINQQIQTINIVKTVKNVGGGYAGTNPGANERPPR